MALPTGAFSCLAGGEMLRRYVKREEKHLHVHCKQQRSDVTRRKQLCIITKYVTLKPTKQLHTILQETKKYLHLCEN